jgi:large subunit ribosomal protein L21
MNAIIETGSKQFKVKAGDIIRVEKLGAIEGEYIFDKVLAILDENRADFGAPFIDGATVSATILFEGRSKKVIVYKYKPKKGFHKKKGHRQYYTQVRIDSINA